MKDDILAWTFAGLTLLVFWNLVDYHPFNAMLLPLTLLKAEILGVSPAALMLDLTGNGG